MPAIRLDAALLHVHRADARGNTLTLSPDPFFDELMARAADRVYVTTERLVETFELDMARQARYNLFERAVITGVAEVPYGAHPTGAAPDYEIDLEHLKTYAQSAASPEGWADYCARFVEVDESHYLAAVGGPAHIGTLRPQAY
jgi:glutaconate CoA-transferase subunit A